MTNDEFLKQFTYLAKKYIRNKNTSDELIKKAEALGASSGKGLMHDFNEHAEPVDSSDSKIIKDIAFYFI